jgi:choice-of-anchor C domain-containing protein
MKKVLTLAISLVLLLACVGTVSAETNLVVNGGFESPLGDYPWHAISAGNELTGWTINYGSIDLVHGGWPSHSGDQSIDLAGNEQGKISQIITTTDLSGTYNIQFWLAGNPYTQGKKALKVYWDGNEVSPTTGSLTFDTTGKSFTDMGWTLVTISGLKATKSTTELAFVQGATDDERCGVALDDISVVDPPVDPPTPAPEFPSTALPAAMLVGFMGVVLFVQKSKNE